ncbi:hypothetical protein NEOLEDRAFT_1140355 [Neolentinus lepideus HHB14362 ss-1]|uniref:Uncharacterized protein n=1 Tax=Neolentinus lepideus HHB14362 ss-1 TaxID=1314782 RepID=A0A165PBX0_9AGAM|nr:hypothetical protein NEOLEDRAFT_1140355 [Neolentinus lepideus HHB14362 ss-1]
MCVVDGSVDQAISDCPMCKVYPPSGARCPHKRDVCRNKAVHPRDVVYLKNAEVQTFNGCGYCKWAESNPPVILSGNRNPGWPGCCRPPGAGETKKVPAADWRAVSLVHHIPIPAEIKLLLERAAANRSSPLHSQSVNTPRSVQPLPPTMERKNSNGSGGSTVKATIVPIRTAPMGIPSKTRTSGSPKRSATSLTGSISRGTGGQLSSSPGAIEQRENQRHTEKRHESPGSKAKELEGSMGRRGSTRHPSVSAALQTSTVAKPILHTEEQTHPTLRRRASTANATATNKSPSPPMKSSDISSKSESISKRPSNRRASLSEVFTGLKVTKKGPNSASSESGGSASSGSLSESTVTSEGFTDYLSDESEAEIQRQAEIKAAQIAQNHMEELEFKAARLQLANVDLRPPKSWNPGSTPSHNSSRA